MDRYALIKDFILLETVIICLFLILTLLFYVFMEYRKKKFNKIELQLNDEIKFMLENNTYQPLSVTKPLDIVIKIIEVYNKAFAADEFWHICLKKIMEDQILPQARKLLKKRNWYNKYLLIKCYRLHFRPKDIGNIIKLTDEKLPVLLINIAKVVSKSHSKKAMKSLIKRLAETHNPLQGLVIMQLLRSDALVAVLLELLSEDPPTDVRNVCYSIISKICPSEKFYPYVYRDITNIEDEVNLSAIRALPFTDENKALSELKELAKDPDWHVRNAAIKSLGKIKNDLVIKLLVNSLSDSQWWVRINAARMLSMHSNNARKALVESASTNPELKKLADYFLSIHMIKQGKANGSSN